MLGDGGLIQAVLAHVHLTENERLSQNISVRGPLWWTVSDYSWFSHSLWCLSLVCGDATLRDLTFPTLAYEDSLMIFLHWWQCSSVSPISLQMGLEGGFCLYTVKQRGTDEIAHVRWPRIQYFFKRLSSMHSNTFTATTVRTSILT